MRHGVPEDIMAHNHIAIEMVPDGAGGLQPNKRPDGMMDVYINFPDPTEQILKRAMERANNRHSPESGVSEGGAGK
jgi:hypothetical protein